MLDLLKKESGDYSLSKVMAVISFAMAIVITVVELLTNLKFEHYAELLAFTAGLVGCAVTRSVMRGRENG